MTEAPVLDGAGGFARWLTTSDGVRIRAVVWPCEAARGTVLILPGRTEHAEKYAGVAADLGSAGYASAAVDWRGQGLADRLLADGRKGHVGHFSEYQLDLAAFRTAVRAEGLPTPTFMLAHSMGGCIGLRALVDGLQVAAAAFSAPMWGIKVPGDQGMLFAKAFKAAATAGLRARYAPPPASGPVCYLETAPFAGNSLTGDEATWNRVQAMLRADPRLCIAGPTIGWLAEAMAECRALGRLPAPQVPCVTGLGSEERIVDPAAIEARMGTWPAGVLHRVAGGRHELLMESPALRTAFLARIIALFDAQPD